MNFEKENMTLKMLLYSLMSHHNCKCEIIEAKITNLSIGLTKQCLYKGTIATASNQLDLINRIVNNVKIKGLRKFVIEVY